MGTPRDTRHDGDPEADARRARRHEASRRRRRQRVAVAVVAAAAGAGAVAATLVLTRGGGPPQGAPATTASSQTATAPGGTVTAGPPRRPPPGGVAPIARQNAAVARVQRTGVPVYRTPGRGGDLVALTFDDGPGPYTATTVATLARYGMRATFFVCGTSIQRFPGALALERRVGVLGNHTWSHAYLPGLTAADATSQIARTRNLLERTSRDPVLLFRPPYGAHTPAIDATVRRLGMVEVLWSIDSGDSAGAGWREMLRRIEDGIGPGDIVLFHENRGQTQKVVNRLLPWMRKHGMRSVSVPELLAADPPSGAYLRTEAGRRGVLTTGGG